MGSHAGRPWAAREFLVVAHDGSLIDNMSSPIGHPWVTHESPMGCPWVMHGMCPMGLPWGFHKNDRLEGGVSVLYVGFG